MFTLADPSKTYRVPVAVSVPTDSATPAKHEFTAEFRLLDRAEVDKLISAGGDREFLDEVLAGWSGIKRHDGGDLEFNKTNLETLSKITYWARSVIDAYLEWQAGLPLKN